MSAEEILEILEEIYKILKSELKSYEVKKITKHGIPTVVIEVKRDNRTFGFTLTLSYIVERGD